MYRSLTLALAALVVSAGCASTNIGTYATRGLDLRQYKTYAWGEPDHAATGDPRLDNNEIFEKRVRAAVDDELAGRGLTKTTGTPDLIVHYHAGVAQEVSEPDIDPDYTYDYHDEGRDPYVYRKGTLFVDLVDPASKRLVWRGWAEGSVDGVIDDQDLLEKRIDDAVARILAKLPGTI
ncbi:MAG: DUF4136 domain-containing protein [Vicinamibacterales bacterium]